MQYSVNESVLNFNAKMAYKQQTQVVVYLQSSKHEIMQYNANESV